MIDRFENWPSLLHGFINERHAMPFAWGTNDCVQFACAWIERATGRRVLSMVYSDAKVAMRKLRLMGGLEAATTATLGEPIEPSAAHRGDVALIALADGRQCLGVVVGALVAAPGATGVVYNPRSAILRAWSV